MNGNLSLLLKKLSIPAILLVLGIIMVYIGLTSEQDAIYKIASIMMMLAGMISLAFSTGNLNRKVMVLIGATTGVISVVLLFYSYKSVSDTTRYNKNYALCRMQAIQNLQDVRYIQKSYMEKNGKYIDNWDELVEYAKTGTVPKLISRGSVPNRPITPEERKFLYNDNRPLDNNMTEQEAVLLSRWKEGPNYMQDFSEFVRDTIQITFKEAKFGTKSYMKSREVAGLPKYAADSLPYIPFTGAREMWKLEVADSVLMGDTKVPAIRVEGEIPFAATQGKKNEKISFGQLTSNDTAGSWEE